MLETPKSTESVREYLSVTELNSVIKQVLDGVIEKNIAVFGEVSGFKISGGHAYFTLKDKDAQIPCTMFGASGKYQPKDGEGVILKGSVDFWTKGGRLNFVVRSIEPVGKGLLYLEFEKLKLKLTEEGLFSETHKKPIPKYAKNVLVLTSVTGAVIKDIATTVRRKNPLLDIIVKDVRVQGASAAKDIVSALKAVDKLGYDVIIIARGGGSLEDLAPFYDEALVRAVYAAKTPIVSAVGHETDFSLCDLVADKRAPTPTAAAELVAFDFYALVDGIKMQLRRGYTALSNGYMASLRRFKLAGQTLNSKFVQNYESKQNRLKMLSMRASAALAKNAAIETKSNKVRMLNVAAVRAVTERLTNDTHKLERLDVALAQLDPVKVLRAGYFKVLDTSGGSLTSVKGLKKGDKITAVASDGRAVATVEDVSLEKVEDK